MPLQDLLVLGAGDPAKFNMAYMGLRLGQRAASASFGRVSRGMFSNLWPGFDESDVPIGSITNGVHAPTWTARELIEMGTQTSSQGDPVEIDGPVHFDGVDKIPAATCGRSAARCVAAWWRRYAAASATRRHPRATEAEVGWTESAFDPDVLTIGFARQVPSYRRLTLMRRDPERLKALLLDPERPMQLVIAEAVHRRRRRQGAHPADGHLRRRPGDPAPDRVPARLRHRDGATSTGVATSG